VSEENLPGSLIWATRGRSWGFRFLLNGGRSDPLLDYERSFADLKDEPTTWRRAAAKVALRFPDPLGRKDAAGRVIPHEFVVSGDLADGIESVEDGVQQIWPLVAGAYARVWDVAGPPSVADPGFTTQDNSTLDAPRCADGDSGDIRADPS
jgi:hypothetical protein